jgi:hypothetical protein
MATVPTLSKTTQEVFSVMTDTLFLVTASVALPSREMGSKDQDFC